MIKKDLDIEFKKILLEYSNNLSNTIKYIDDLWLSLIKNWDPKKIKKFYEKIHGLHGSAGIFGFSELSDVAGQLEIIIKQFVNNPTPSSDQKKKIENLLKELTIKSLVPNNDICLPEPLAHSEVKNKILFFLNLGERLDKSNLTSLEDTQHKLKILGYEINDFENVESLEKAVIQTPPLAILINIDLVNESEEIILNKFKIKYLNKTTLIFFSKSNDFNLRLKAIKLGGQAYLPLPFSADDLIYDLDRISSTTNDIYSVLIIDDEMKIAKFLSIILNYAGMTTHIATNINEIENALRKHNPDIILTDFYMPDCNGIELTSILRQQKKYEFVPIIFLSIEENKIKQLNAVNAGGDEFLTKKIKPHDLIEAVRSKAHRYKVLKLAYELQEYARKLETAKLIAEEKNRLNNIFLTNISHELRTPINGVMGYTQLLQLDPLTEQQNEYLDGIKSCNDHLLKLINDIFDISEIQSHRLKFENETVELAELLNDEILKLNPLIHKKKINFFLSIDKAISTIFIDPARLKQILFNYLSNAIKFTPEKGTIKLKIINLDDNKFRIEIEDNGIGMSKENIDKIWVAFQQLDQSSTKKYAGMGLGLVLTKSIVEALGGEVGVTSSPGKGSTFYAILPKLNK